MKAFIAKQEMVFISTSDTNGECDASVRFGESGFVIVLDDKHLLYPEFHGNGVMASMGNITENPHIGLVFIDFFETKIGLHVNGKAKIIHKDEIKRVVEQFDYPSEDLTGDAKASKTVSYILIEIEEAYIHCSLHIPLLKKVDKVEYPEKFLKFGKGGDAFGIKNHKSES
jgi:predicted pyridoxine 5'-phosphate oxidase superfamily flavin-nucleotide-binding protein